MAKDEEQRGQEAAYAFRDVLAKAYAAVLSRDALKSFATFTWEDAAKLQLERLESSGSRPSERARLEKLSSDLKAAVTKLKSPEMKNAFPKPKKHEDANTPVEDEDE